MKSRDSQAGGLVSLDLSNESRQAHFEDGVFDIEKSGRDLWALHSLAADPRALAVSVWRASAFEELGRLTLAENDAAIALLNKDGSPVILSRKAIHVLAPDKRAWRTTVLKGELRRGVQISAAAPAKGDAIYVGFNMGEWGGGLQRLDIATGAVATVEHSEGACGGLLNTDCSPVTGVIPDSQDPRCVLAAVGLVHLWTSNGRILRVCGDSVAMVFEKPMKINPGDGPGLKMTEAFYGLTQSEGSGFWAVSWRALYRFVADRPAEHPLPKNLKPISGIYMSRELPGAVVVQTDVNASVSTSGYTPLVIPLEGS
ncbi:MAG TPA: hypothetical protein VGH16_22885 [Candidatus Binatia bacterium]